jgi:hypothetical protein
MTAATLAFSRSTLASSVEFAEEMVGEAMNADEATLTSEESDAGFKPLPENRVSAFVMAGNATFTVVSKRTGARFTYRVRAAREKNDRRFFVSVLTGSNNESDYEFLGTIFPKKELKDCRSPRDAQTRYFHGRRSRINESAPSAKAFGWFFERMIRGLAMPEADVHHCGRCGRCGRKLTVPESIEIGLGPECAEKGSL